MTEFRDKPEDAGSPQAGNPLGVRAVIFPHVGEVARPAFCALTSRGDEVAALAMRSPQVDRRRTVSAAVVYGVTHELHVGATDACAIPAEMVTLHPCRAIRHREVMRPNGARAFQVKFSVTVWLNSTEPDPARAKVRSMLRNRAVLVDFFPEALCGRPVRRHVANLSTKGGC